jgi:tetratricopeptide (TPR) repeat protein
LTEAYKLFENEAYNLQLSPYFGLAVAQKLRARFGENLISNQILETSRNQHADNPEVLKSLAYFLQSQRQYNDALLIYRKLLALRPDYAQSYRDLANSLVETKAYEQAWKTYMQYLNKTGELTESGIDKLVFDEMQGLFNQKRKQLPPEAGMETADPEETQQDVRLVFEWNTSEAEFELEFVNPGKQVFVFDHTYKNNNELFTDEKTKGYSSEKFYIETLGIGQWMVNLTYHGNKKYDPTYLKVNIYYNWGKANQRQETKVFNLLQTGIKTNLLMLSQANLVAQE